MNSSKPNKKIIIGTVVSDKMEKTVTVKWEQRIKHPIYKKFVKQHTKIRAHDNNNEAQIGDVVKIIATRPISKGKSFRVVEIIEKAQRG